MLRGICEDDDDDDCSVVVVDIDRSSLRILYSLGRKLKITTRTTMNKLSKKKAILQPAMPLAKVVAQIRDEMAVPHATPKGIVQ